MSSEEKRLLNDVQDVVRYKHYSIYTKRAYRDWIKRYVQYHRVKPGRF